MNPPESGMILSIKDGVVVRGKFELESSVDTTFIGSELFPYMTKADWLCYNCVMLGPGHHFLPLEGCPDDVLMRRLLSFRRLKEDFRTREINLIRVNYWLSSIGSELAVRARSQEFFFIRLRCAL
jgi:hypothetical protein